MLSIAPFMEVLDTTIANVSLTHIAGSLAASQDESTWILTSYLVSNSIVLPISGWLSQVIGRKRFYQICVVDLHHKLGRLRVFNLAVHDDHIAGHSGPGRRRPGTGDAVDDGG